VRVVEDNVLVGVAIYLDEITQSSFVISLSTGENPGKELIGGIGWRQGQSFS
jgi:hypothetical protein